MKWVDGHGVLQCVDAILWRLSQKPLTLAMVDDRKFLCGQTQLQQLNSRFVRRRVQLEVPS